MRYYKHQEMGHFDFGWLKTYHHFSFGDYHNHNRMHFGALRVVNDDIVAPHNGFQMHPHRDMEIISYIVSGGLTHEDSMNHKNTVYRGEVQYMSAGSGVYHSEVNEQDEPVRLLQIWIYPDQKNYEPSYGDHQFIWEDRVNRWLHLVGSQAPIQVHQDADFYVTYLEAGQSLTYEISKDRQVYIVSIENDVQINDIILKERDALEIEKGVLSFTSFNGSHLLLIDLSSRYKKS